MGTRADFYVGRGANAEWLGSIAFDGYPDGIPAVVRAALNEDEYRQAVRKMLTERDYGTVPEQGWPWPWKDSLLTDYAYTFDEGRVWACYYGYVPWFDPMGEELQEHGEQQSEFPDMTERKRVTWGPRSGLIAIKFD